MGAVPGPRYSRGVRTKERRETSRRRRFSARPSNKREGRRQRKFRAGPDFFRLAVESLTEYALVTTDKELRITSWSGPAAAIFGYKESEILGKSISVLFTPEDVKFGVDKREFESALENGREDDERWHVRKDGTRLWCYGLSFPLKDESGEFRGYVKMVRDESDRKRRDELLREKEERLRLAAESTGLGTFDYDVQKGTLQLSDRGSELFGLGRGRKSFGFGQFVEKVEPADRDRVKEVFDRLLQAATGRDADVEYRIRMPDEHVRWVRTLVRGFCEKGREEGVPPLRLLGTVVDITDSRKRQAEDRERSAELESRVKRRTTQLTALNKELETFAYSASHDLRAPLRKIAAYSQAILESGGSALSADDRKSFERIQAATTKMHQLIDDTLALSRVTRKPLELEDCDLSAMAREIAGDLRERAGGRQVDFVIAQGLRAEGDRNLLSVVLRNLLENAWKFTSRHPRARIEFGMKRVDGRPVYFVKDDGAGFDMKYAHKLFGAFRRLHSEKEFSGSGVGLGMAERVIRRHRGRIWADAHVEEGATFFFTLFSENE